MSGNFIGILGIAVILGIAYLLSTNRQAIKLRVVGAAFGLQAVIAAFVIYVPLGQRVIDTMSTAVMNVMAYSRDGISFIFGGLATLDGEIGRASSSDVVAIWSFAVNVLPVIIF